VSGFAATEEAELADGVDEGAEATSSVFAEGCADSSAFGAGASTSAALDSAGGPESGDAADPELSSAVGADADDGPGRAAA
jgi:hypothetical protein